MDLAKLGLAVDANNAIIALDRTGKKLDEVGAAGTRVEQSTNRVSRELEAMSRQATQAEQSTGRVGREINNSSAAANRLLGALSPLTAQMTGMNGAALNVARAIGMIELSSTALVGALASVAVAGAVWRLWTKDIRELHDEIEKTIAAQKDLNDQRAFGAKLPLLQANADMAAQAEFLREQIEYKEKWGGYLVGGANDPKVMRAELKALTASINENKKALLELEPVNQMYDGDLAARTREILNEAKARREAALAVAEYTRQLGNLNILLDAANRDVPSTMDVQLGLGSRGFGGVPGRSGPASYYRDMVGGIRIPGSINTPISVPAVPSGALGGHGNDVMAGFGGLLSGSGVGGAASGILSGGLSAALGGGYAALAGAVGQFVGSLFDSGAKLRREAEANRRAFDMELDARRAAAAGRDGEAASIRLIAQHERELKEARAAGMTGAQLLELKTIQGLEGAKAARERELDAMQDAIEAENKLADARREANATLQAALDTLVQRNATLADYRNDLLVRRYRLSGQDYLGDEQELVNRYGREIAFLNANGASESDIALWREVLKMESDALKNRYAIKVAEDQLRVAEDQLRVQERMVEETRRVVTSLTEYGRGLLTGSFSTLSPFGQLTEARSQFGMLRSLAMGGDLTAAQSLTGAGNTLLSASRGYNASGAGYVGDFKLVQDAIEAVRGKYANQLTVEERTYNEIRAQTVILRDTLTTLQHMSLTATTPATPPPPPPPAEIIPGEIYGYNNSYQPDPVRYPGTWYGTGASPDDVASWDFTTGTRKPGYTQDESGRWIADALFEGLNALAQKLESVEVAVREGTSQTRNSLDAAIVNRGWYDEG